MDHNNDIQNNNSTNNNTHITPPQRFLRFGWYPIGHVTLVAGDPGVGKSYLTHELGARCSDQSHNVLIISLEDDMHDTIIPRMAMMNANFDRVHITNTPIAFDTQLDQLEIMISDNSISLVIIDPIVACMGAYNSDSNNDVRTMLTRLSMLAQTHRAAIVCVTHLSKAEDYQARQGVRALGAQAFTNAVPVVVVVHEEDNGRRRVSMLKNTLCPLLPDETFRITNDRGVVFDPLHVPEDVSERPERSRPRPVLRKHIGHKADAAIDFLVRTLRAGPVPTKDILAQGKARGLSRNTLVRAKETLMIESIKQGKGWYWIRSHHNQGRKEPTG